MKRPETWALIKIALLIESYLYHIYIILEEVNQGYLKIFKGDVDKIFKMFDFEFPVKEFSTLSDL